MFFTKSASVRAEISNPPAAIRAPRAPRAAIFISISVLLFSSAMGKGEFTPYRSQGGSRRLSGRLREKRRYGCALVMELLRSPFISPLSCKNRRPCFLQAQGPKARGPTRGQLPGLPWLRLRQLRGRNLVPRNSSARLLPTPSIRARGSGLRFGRGELRRKS